MRIIVALVVLYLAACAGALERPTVERDGAPAHAATEASPTAAEREPSFLERLTRI
jgi:hypothetical protein